MLVDMQSQRKVNEILKTIPTIEGAGVRLHRGFANAEVPRFDPFLLFDDFSSPNPNDYLQGFPWHPHRGIETVTYVLDGDVRHKDSIGNSGVIRGGDIQWMTAGSGIIHEEMPEGNTGIKGFQLWVNLPKSEKMMKPRYQEVGATSIPEVSFGTHGTIKVIAGTIDGTKGPVEDIMAAPMYLDVALLPEQTTDFPVVSGYTTFLYVIDGAIASGDHERIDIVSGSIVHFERVGDHVQVTSGSAGARFLLVSGKPLDEPIAWRGPIVMNTKEELMQAFDDLATGNFIR